MATEEQGRPEGMPSLPHLPLVKPEGEEEVEDMSNAKFENLMQRLEDETTIALPHSREGERFRLSEESAIWWRGYTSALRDNRLIDEKEMTDAYRQIDILQHETPKRVKL